MTLLGFRAGAMAPVAFPAAIPAEIGFCVQEEPPLRVRTLQTRAPFTNCMQIADQMFAKCTMIVHNFYTHAGQSAAFVQVAQKLSDSLGFSPRRLRHRGGTGLLQPRDSAASDLAS